MTIIVTGAAGFIGSNIVKTLNERGEKDIIAVDNLTHAPKFKNLVDCEISDYFDKASFHARLLSGGFGRHIRAIFHEGACSDTTASDGRYVMENNFRYSQDLLDWCLKQQVPLLYASSAATYGGSSVFAEDRSFESPLNVYGYSKFLFDQVVRERLQGTHSQVVGFRYFNVYGPRESHKGRMASVAFHHFNQFRTQGKVKLFSGCDGYGDGEQRRDFVYVKDVVKANLFFFDHPEKSGIFNLGTGQAASFNALAAATVNACLALEGKPAQSLEKLVASGLIEYIPFPLDLQGKYQSFTEANLTRLREQGYSEKFFDVNEGVADYVAWLSREIGD